MDTQHMIRNILANVDNVSSVPSGPSSANAITNDTANTSSVPNGPSSANATANAADMIAKQLAELKNKIDSKHKKAKKSKSNTNKRVNKKTKADDQSKDEQSKDEQSIDIELPSCIERRLRLITENAKQLTSEKQIKTLKIWLNDLNTKMQLLAMDEVDKEDSED